jgi:3-methyladenine DNA glycosylase AlkC
VQLSKDKNDLVRKAVADNPNTPSAVLAKLAKDENVYVRKAVYENPNTPQFVILF